MRNMRAIVMMTASVALASTAAFLAWHYLRTQAKVDTSAVVVASRALELGSKVTPDSIMLVAWPTESRPEGAFVEVSPLLRNWSRRRELLSCCTLPSDRPTLPCFW